MSMLIWGSIAVVAALGLWPTAIYVRRWWLKPYRNPGRLLRQLQHSLRLSGADRRELRGMLGKEADPIQLCQLMLDPTRWPTDSTSESVRSIFSKLFQPS